MNIRGGLILKTVKFGRLLLSPHSSPYSPSALLKYGMGELAMRLRLASS
eukprot:CAMPEP_0197879702 /NCGR_PEP_ID=MMETSP1439-20131203/7726_1 /TAXON_ID=66791 /ORGANISM="Gonyaulax spinifera, Strain CCMP409" /LENGTH=48 /DNA_ID= /DNA_START= /DNA_END= /DNA_ORIENTATION=